MGAASCRAASHDGLLSAEQVGHYYRSDLELLGLANDSDSRGAAAGGNGSTGSGALWLGGSDSGSGGGDDSGRDSVSQRQW